jgi:hypothetical protein
LQIFRIVVSNLIEFIAEKVIILEFWLFLIHFLYTDKQPMYNSWEIKIKVIIKNKHTVNNNNNNR